MVYFQNWQSYVFIDGLFSELTKLWTLEILGFIRKLTFWLYPAPIHASEHIQVQLPMHSFKRWLKWLYELHGIRTRNIC